MTIEELKKYKRILILGYGREGQATHAFLKGQVPDSEIGFADKNQDPNYLDKQKNYDLVIKTPGIRKELVTIPYTTATNIFFANVKGKTIGVTGSKGKSTASSLIYGIFKLAGWRVHLTGNIGRPMLGELLKSNREDDIFIVELSSYQLDDINYSPDISVILNLFQGHMDYHGGLPNYWSAKKRIIEKATKDNYFIFNSAYEELVKLSKKTAAKSIPFVVKLPLSEEEIPLLGKHNLDNVRAAVTVAELLKIKKSVIKEAIMKFKSLPHRLEFVGEFKGIKFYDDAISTTPESAIAALKSLSKIETILLGGEDRGYDFSDLASTIINFKIPNIVLFPDSGSKILESIKKEKGGDFNPVIFKTDDMKEAVLFAYKNTPQGTICLLSSASPSFSLWRNFEEKGDLFQKFVKEYAQKKI